MQRVLSDARAVLNYQKRDVILAVSLIKNEMSLKICRAVDDCGSRGAWDLRIAVKCGGDMVDGVALMIAIA